MPLVLTEAFTPELRLSSLPPQEGKYYSEEAEVDLRDPGRDYELYKYTCQELQRLMAEIQDLKSRGGKDMVRTAQMNMFLVNHMDGTVFTFSRAHPDSVSVMIKYKQTECFQNLSFYRSISLAPHHQLP